MRLLSLAFVLLLSTTSFALVHQATFQFKEQSEIEQVLQRNDGLRDLLVARTLASGNLQSIAMIEVTADEETHESGSKCTILSEVIFANETSTLLAQEVSDVPCLEREWHLKQR